MISGHVNTAGQGTTAKLTSRTAFNERRSKGRLAHNRQRLATVPLTSGLVATFFGTTWMSMLFGVSGDVGGDFPAWLMGLFYDANTGERALNLIETYPFDVIVLNLVLVIPLSKVQ